MSNFPMKNILKVLFQINKDYEKSSLFLDLLHLGVHFLWTTFYESPEYMDKLNIAEHVK